MRRDVYKLGFLTSSLASPEGVRLLGAINAFYAADRYDADLLMFFADMAHVDRVVMCAVFNSTEVFDFGGDVVATDLESASRLLKCPGPRRRFLWLDGPDWSDRRDAWTYGDFAAVYRNPRIEVLAGSDESAAMFRRCWNREVFGVVGLDDVDRILGRLR